MTKGELRKLIQSAIIYKMSLGRDATLRDEALKNNALVFASDKDLFEAVLASDDAAILRTGTKLRDPKYPRGNAPENAISVWRRSIETFCSLPSGTLIVHWEAGHDRLHWGISEDGYKRAREERDEFGQPMWIFHRGLTGGWRSDSLGGIPLSNIHPKGRELAINMATINRVQTDTDYFRALIADEDTSGWESRPEWQVKARDAGWHPKPKASLLATRRKKLVTPPIEEAVDHFLAEIARMAATAAHTAAYANGQTVLTTVKNKDISFTRAELEEEIASLLDEQKHRCALTGYDFKRADANVHLKMSLDRRDSAKGYEPGNLQVVTRAANFYKSASGEEDWALKAKALEHMAVAIQQRRKAATPLA